MQPGHLPGGRTANLAIIGAPDSLTALLLSRRQGPSVPWGGQREIAAAPATTIPCATRSEEHTSELQSQSNLVCRLLLEKKKNTTHTRTHSCSHRDWQAPGNSSRRAELCSCAPATASSIPFGLFLAPEVRQTARPFTPVP